jgi:cobalt/nickel transport protein
MRRRWGNAGLVGALAVACLLAPWASSAPDGLERVAERLQFAHRAAAHAFPAPMPAYRVPAVAGASAGTALAGIAGTLVVFVASAGVGHLMRRKRSTQQRQHAARRAHHAAGTRQDDWPDP